MNESILKCENLCFSYDENLSLDNINIDIERGSITAILGRNGAGKSTLFLTITGINIKDSGNVYFNNKEITYNKKGIAEIRKKIGADSLGYLDIKRLCELIKSDLGVGYCDACFTADYPTKVPENKGKNKFDTGLSVKK